MVQGRKKDPALVLRDKHLCQMFQQENVSLQAVGDCFGITRERVRQVLKMNGIDDRRKWSITNTGKREAALKLYAVGISSGEIQEIFGHSGVPLIGSAPRQVRAQRRIALFWQSIAVTSDPTKCWNWMGAGGEHGYARTFFKGSYYGRHVLALWLHTGIKPLRWVLHTCDNPPCCNPAHLYEGTPQDNVRDREVRMRSANYTGNNKRRLTYEDVLQIRKLVKDGVTQVKVASMLGFTFAAIHNVCRGRTWKDPKGIKAVTDKSLRAIYELLAEAQITQAYVTQRFGIHPQTVAKIKAGTHPRVKKFLHT